MDAIIAAWKRYAVLAKDVAQKMDVFKCSDTEVRRKQGGWGRLKA
jgi:hypothetical protein